MQTSLLSRDTGYAAAMAQGVRPPVVASASPGESEMEDRFGDPAAAFA
jgi:hypothetical protein